MTDGGNVDDWYSIRVWVGNIGRYNEGVLEGAWATLPMRETDLDAFLRDRVGIDGVRYEEYRIDDYERPDWMPRGVIDQHTRVEDLNVLANVLTGLSGGREDAAKAGVWMEEMMPDGRSPLAFANLALQADGIPFLAYSAGSPETLGCSCEEAFALSLMECDGELRETYEGPFGMYLDMEAIGRDRVMDCTLYADGYLDRSVDADAHPELYSRGELMCLAGLDDNDDVCAASIVMPDPVEEAGHAR